MTTYFSDSDVFAGLATRNMARKWGLMGDSITVGSGASNVVRSYGAIVTTAAGMAYHRAFVNAGIAGNTTAQMLARFKTDIIDAGCEGVVIMGGTNDAGGGVTLATYISNITDMVKMARSYGLPVILCTVPPRGSGQTASYYTQTSAYNLWIRTLSHRLGVWLADVNAALVDPATGYLASDYDSGDGVHPSNWGHLTIANCVGAVMQTIRPQTIPLVSGRGISAGEGSSNPLMTGTLAATRPDDWVNQVAPAGTGTITRQVIAKPDSFDYGQAFEIQADGTAGSCSVTERTSFVSGVGDVDDVIALSFRLEIEDVAGNYEDENSSANAEVHVSMNQSFINITSFPIRGPMIVPPTWIKTTLAASSGISVWFAVTCPSGANFKARLGEVQLFNLTELGLEDLL